MGFDSRDFKPEYCCCQHLIQCVYLIIELFNNGAGQEAALISRMAPILSVNGHVFPSWPHIKLEF